MASRRQVGTGGSDQLVQLLPECLTKGSADTVKICFEFADPLRPVLEQDTVDLDRKDRPVREEVIQFPPVSWTRTSSGPRFRQRPERCPEGSPRAARQGRLARRSCTQDGTGSGGRAGPRVGTRAAEKADRGVGRNRPVDAVQGYGSIQGSGVPGLGFGASATILVKQFPMSSAGRVTMLSTRSARCSATEATPKRCVGSSTPTRTTFIPL